MPRSSRDSLRASNQHAIFDTIHRRGPISRADIATHLHLSPAAVTNITGDLMSRNLIFEAGQAESDGVGRRATLLEVDYDHALVLGVKVSNAGVTCALTNLNAEVLYAPALPLAETSPASVVATIAEAIDLLAPQIGEKRLVALGINLPGIVDDDQETVRHSPLLGWARVPLGRLLRERLAVPVLVENDVNAFAQAEAWFGHGQDHHSFLVVTLGRGVGLGVVLNGSVYRGPHGGAGEFGHIPLSLEHDAPRRGGPDTLEGYLSDQAFLARARGRIEAFPDDADPDTLISLARDGHPEALALYREAGTTLGRALGILVNIFAPSLIILGGEGVRGAEFFLPTAEATLKEVSFGDLAGRLQLVVDPWGDDAWARGAAALVASRHLTDAATQLGGD